MTTRNSQTLMQTSGDDTFDFLFKIVLIGDCSVGKTKIVQRFKTGNFTESHANTIGVDFSMKTITVDGKKVKVCVRIRQISNWIFYMASKSLCQKTHTARPHTVFQCINSLAR